MKHLVLVSFVVGLLAGCASQQPKPEEKPALAVAPKAPPAAKPEAPVTKPAERPAVKVDPFSDPGNPLSKRSIYYDFDKSTIKEENKPIVHAHASYLAKHARARVLVEGNCDERGSREYNLALGQRRADSLKNMMKLLGASEDQIETASWGKEKPKAQGHDEAAWAENRRSDIIYLKKE